MKKLLLFLFVLLALPAYAQTFGGNSGADTFVLPPWRFCFGPDPGGQNACFFQSANQTAFERGHLDYQYTLNTVSHLPQAGATFMQGRVYWVSDGVSSADCSQGGGFNFVLCVSNGSIWVPIGGGGGSGVPTLMRTVSPNGATLNQLVTYDCTHLDANGVCEVQNAAAGAKNVIGVCAGNCVIGQIATIGTYLSAPVVMDGPATPGDTVAPSASVGGFATDESATTSQPNVQTIGRVSKANSGGSGTTAQVDFFLGDLLAPGSSSNGNAQITPCTTAGCMIFEPQPNVPTITGDNSTITNGSGSVTMKSLGLTDPNHAGNWFETQGPTPLPAPTNSTLFYVGPSIPTPNSFQLPKAAGAADVNKAWGVTSSTTDGNGNPVDIMGIINASGTTLPGAGTLVNPSAPTLTVNGTTGATQYCYVVIGSEDSGATFHSAATSSVCVSNGNATLSSSNSITLSAYIDSTYGYRGVIVCRVTGGATQGVITNGLLAGKKFIDTGLTADGTNCATVYASNTTFIWDACLGSSLPGNPSVPGAPCGVDGPPLTPTAFDDECNQTFGAPGDANDPFWTRVNFGSATATWSNGACIITGDNTAAPNLEILTEPLPGSTPYTFTVFVDQLAGASGGDCSLGFRESSSGKMVTLTLANLQTAGSSTAAGGFGMFAINWTSFSATSNLNFLAYQGAMTSGVYFRLQNDGTNIKTFWSPGTDGVNYQSFGSELISSAFTTGPNLLLLGVSSANVAAAVAPSCTFDYARRTQ